jgi:hypothetical protein
MSRIQKLNSYLTSDVSIAPLVSFRILFYGLFLFGALRFIDSGWIYELYNNNEFYFKFYGLEWVPNIGSKTMLFIYQIMIVSSLFSLLGLFYRLSASVTFIAFFFYEFTDATNYLNHYYLVLLLLFLLIFLPANRAFSLDTRFWKIKAYSRIPRYMILILQLQLAFVYFFAGLAKLNTDWMMQFMPMAVWLPSKSDLPLIGPLLAEPITAVLFSYGGAVYDLSIAFFLFFKRTRPIAYVFVLAFHLMVGLLFNIGLFPWIMILSTTIFFSGKKHTKILSKIGFNPNKGGNFVIEKIKPVYFGLGLYILFQMILPLRHLMYPGNVLWHEQGYRFSWRVMLVEKAGVATFKVFDEHDVYLGDVDNKKYLSAYQEKQMAIQPDFILQYAQYLKVKLEEEYEIKNIKIKCDCFAALNGRASQRLVDQEVDLSQEVNGWTAKSWITPLMDN